jgi:acyl CoA:acetate/3-ketoacid CoA transferase
MARTKFVSAEEAARAIKNGDSVAISGNGAGMTSAEAIFAAIEKSFLETGEPRDLTLVHSLGLGDRADLGLNRFAHEGMLRRLIGSHFTWSTRLQQLIRDEKIEAYCFPAGAVQQLLREIGAGRPGLITHSGLGTFVDPRQDGGRCNQRTTEEMVEMFEIDGRELLRYKPFKVDVAIIRGTYADERGNISPEEEAMDLDIHTMALAAHNCDGVVLAQVREVVKAGTLKARNVRIPGVMVDAVVEDRGQEMFYGLPYDLSISGSQKVQLEKLSTELPKKLERRIIARRAAMELKPDASLNFGFGIPGGIFGVIAEQGIEDQLWMSVEQGAFNGRMLDDRLFGAARKPDVLVASVDQFDYYSGGGIDEAFLGMGEADAEGNVNVSHLGGSLVGPGGFIEIAQNAKKVVFCGTFDALGSEVAFDGGRLRVVKPGRIRKFVNAVERITFSARYARQQGQEVLYVTERCVFCLDTEGIRLVEIAPGFDFERDIVAHMAFRPIVGEVKQMDLSLFA